MRSQVHNQGPLVELKVEIEKEVHESLVRMAQNSKLPVADLVVIALKRFRSSHSDYEDRIPEFEV